jgi:hypothetical protein
MPPCRVPYNLRMDGRRSEPNMFQARKKEKLKHFGFEETACGVETKIWE